MKTMYVKLIGVTMLAFMLCLTGLVMSGEVSAQRTVTAQQCVDNFDGTVTDNVAGLMWQSATIGPLNWEAAKSHASSLALGGHTGWHVNRH